MENILFIHGFGGDVTSSTGRNVESVLKDMNEEFTFYKETFELMDYEGTISQIDRIVKEKNITLIIAHSFGAFYASCFDKCKKILINPCLTPSTEIPRILVTPTPCEKESFEKYFNSDFSSFVRVFKEKEEKEKNKENRVYGIFAKDDELFHFQNMFTSLYPSDEENSILVSGGHKISKESLEVALPKAFKYIKG